MPAEFISSESNNRIKLIKALRDRKKARYAERLFVVEGPRFVDDAFVYATPVLLAVSETRAIAGEYLDTGVVTIVVPDPLFAQISDTQTPQGVLALFPIPEPFEAEDINSLVVVADGIQDPGNLGTLIRSSAALGATRVICAKGTVDPWSPKVTRGAAASIFQLPLVVGADLAVDLKGLTVHVAESVASLRVDQADWTGPSAMIIGSEGSGIVSDLTGLDPIAVTIPMARSVDSLNAGVAASIVLYEASRQRAG